MFLFYYECTSLLQMLLDYTFIVIIIFLAAIAVLIHTLKMRLIYTLENS